MVCGYVGSPQSMGIEGDGLQQPLPSLGGKRGADLGAGSLFPKDEPSPSLQRCDSLGKLKGYMTPKYQLGPQPQGIHCPVTQMLPTKTLEPSHTCD